MGMRHLFFAFIAALFVGIAAVAVLPAAPAYACTCVATPTEEEYHERADFVVDGVVTTLQEPASIDSPHPTRVEVAVERVTKGEVGDQLALSTPSGTCGFPFEIGQRYRVYASAGQTTLCSGNQKLAAVDGEATDTESQAPAGWAAVAPPPVLAVAGLPVLAGGGLAYLLIRRRRKSPVT